MTLGKNICLTVPYNLQEFVILNNFHPVDLSDSATKYPMRICERKLVGEFETTSGAPVYGRLIAHFPTYEIALLNSMLRATI